MTGYELSRKWFDWAWNNPDLNSTTMCALFMWLIEKWNRCGQPEKLSITASESMYVLNIKSRNTYSQAFALLVEHGFIKIVVKSSNQHSCTVISLAQNLSKHKDSKRTALDQALIQQRGKQEDSTDTINKQVNNDISSRKLKFSSDLKPFLEKYGKEMLNAFYKYWTEPNTSKTKLRKELEKTWDISLRLENWASRDNNFSNHKPVTTEPTGQKLKEWKPREE